MSLLNSFPSFSNGCLLILAILACSRVELFSRPNPSANPSSLLDSLSLVLKSLVLESNLLWSTADELLFLTKEEASVPGSKVSRETLSLAASSSPSRLELFFYN